MKKNISFVIFSLFLLNPLLIKASEVAGSIDSGAKLTKICKNASCSDYGNVNWKPTLNGNTTGATPISIADSGITGFAWGDEIGWINLAPTGAGVHINPATGELSGTAYSSVGGWINFSPTGSGVSLVDNGSGSSFYGYAYVSGINGGWMKFDCADSSTCIKTDWRNTTHRSSTSGTGGSTGGGNSGVIVTTVPPSEVSNPISTIPPSAYENFPGVLTTGNNHPSSSGSEDSTSTVSTVSTEDNLRGYPSLYGGTKQPLSSSCNLFKSFSCIAQNKIFIPGFSAALILLGIFAFLLGRKRFDI